MAKYLITPSLLNSWKYAISDENDYGNLDDFKKVLNKEPMEVSEAIQKGFDYEEYMIENYEPTKDGCYQVVLYKDIETKTGKYLLYGRLDCLKAGKIYDYKYTGSYDVGKFYDNYQTPIYMLLAEDAYEMEYLICNNFNKGKTLDELNIYHEVYRKDETKTDIGREIDNFINWLKTNKLYEIFCEKWVSKYD